MPFFGKRASVMDCLIRDVLSFISGSSISTISISSRFCSRAVLIFSRNSEILKSSASKNSGLGSCLWSSAIFFGACMGLLKRRWLCPKSLF